MSLKAAVLSLVLFISISSIGQSLDSIDFKRVDFGFLLGPNFTTIDSTSMNDRMGFELGILANTRITQRVSLDLAPSISFQDYTYGNGNEIEETVLSIPVTLGVQAINNKNFPYIFGGIKAQYDLIKEPRYNEPTYLLYTGGMGWAKKFKYFTFAPRLIYSRNSYMQQFSLQILLRG